MGLSCTCSALRELGCGLALLRILDIACGLETTASTMFALPLCDGLTDKDAETLTKARAALLLAILLVRADALVLKFSLQSLLVMHCLQLCFAFRIKGMTNVLPIAETTQHEKFFSGPIASWLIGTRCCRPGYSQKRAWGQQSHAKK
jgi:hypothetical protein